MTDFSARYRSLFERFGSPLKKSDAMAASVVDKAAGRLGVAIPEALRRYYLVAGNERRFNRSLQRFLHPSKWSLDQHRLAFVDENQSVCCWGVSTKSAASLDPTAWQGVDDGESISWRKVQDKCSRFLEVLLHYQAVSGGFRHCAAGASPDDVHASLKRGWKYAGESQQLWAFSRQDQAVCIMAGGGMPWMPAMMLLAGGRTAADLESIRTSLKVKFD